MNKVTDPGDERITDVGEAYDAALVEQAQNEEHWSALADLKRQVGQAAAERHQRLVDAVLDKETADDGPGRDQHGPHERHVLDTGDQPTPADDPLMTTVLGLLRDRELGYARRRKTAQRIIAAVRDADRRASHEGATVSDLVAERFQGGETR